MTDEKPDQPDTQEAAADEQPLKTKGSTTDGYHTYREDLPSSATIAERQRQRDEMASDIEAFLAKGGEVTSVERNVRADPPKKPESNYGSRPI